MKGIYIIIGIVVLGLIALMAFGKKNNTAATANTGQPAGEQGGGWGSDFGLTFGANFGTNRQPGQSFSNWFNNRQQQGWAFNNNLL